MADIFFFLLLHLSVLQDDWYEIGRTRRILFVTKIINFIKSAVVLYVRHTFIIGLDGPLSSVGKLTCQFIAVSIQYKLKFPITDKFKGHLTSSEDFRVTWYILHPCIFENRDRKLST